MGDYSLLSLKNIYPADDCISSLKKYGKRAFPTDFFILLGGYATSQGAYWWLKDRKASSIPPSVYYVDDYALDTCPASARCEMSQYGIRPVIPYRDIQASSKITEDGSLSFTVEYGEFPQTIEKRDVSSMLESLYQIGGLSKTGKIYTVNDYMKQGNKETRNFVPKPLSEYELSGKKYVRIMADLIPGDEYKTPLSNGTVPEHHEIYWVKVEPIQFIVDRMSGIAITKNVLMCGIPFSHSSSYTGSFEDSDICKYMEFYFSDEIRVTKEEMKKPEKKETKPRKKTTPFGFTFTNVTEDEIIEGCLKADVAVFLHGKSSDGKSARVKALDPDCEIIYLRNTTPEALNGKSVYNSNTGEMLDIPPTWYKRMMDKCAAYPDRIHILFLDEITNALHSIQGMAFNIVLNKEVNGIWKLPDNVRIVAAGNDLSDSLAANTLAEPLFNRFAHVYIKTDAKSWLEWAVSPETSRYLPYEKAEVRSRIHPAVYAYISSRGDSALRTPYTGEKPNADPRKWELASRLLYATGRPMMLKALVGSDLAKDFTTFCKKETISIMDVVEGKVDMDVVAKMSTSEKYSVVVTLSLCGENNLAVVRSFVRKLEPEFLSVFDSMWLQSNPGKEEVLAYLYEDDVQ